MASSTVAAWKECLQQLEQNNALPLGHARLEGAAQRVDALGLHKQQGPLPPTTWRKVVVDLQMPRRISAACADAARQDPGGPAAAAAVAAVRGLVATAKERAAAAGTNNSSQLLAVLEQIERSGLLQHLPALFTAAAEGLAAKAAAGSSWHHAAAAITRAEDLLFLCAMMPELWSAGEARLAMVLPWMPAAMQLINTAVQSVDRLCLSVKQQQQPSKLDSIAMPVLGTFVRSCFYASVNLSCILLAMRSASLMEAGSLSQPRAAAWLQSAHLLPCLAWTSCVAFLAWTADWPAASTAQSRSSSGGGGNAGSSRTNRGSSSSNRGDQGTSSTSSPAKASILCWQQASANLAQHVTPCHEQLIQLLNVSGYSVMWAAGIVRHTSTNISDIYRDVGRLLMVCAHVNKQQHMAELPQPKGQLQQQEHLALLLHSLWLPSASKFAEDKPIDSSFWMGAIAHIKAGFWESLALWCSSRYGKAHWERVASHRETTVVQPQQQQLPAVLLQDALPHLLHVLGVLLEQPRGVGQDAALQELLQGTQLGYLAALHVLLVYSGLPDGGSLTATAASSVPQDSHQPSAPQPSASAATTVVEQQLAATQVVRDNMLPMLQVLESYGRHLAVNNCSALAAAPAQADATKAAAPIRLALSCINIVLSKLLAVLTSSPSSSHTEQLPPPETSAVYSLASSLLKAGNLLGALPATQATSAVQQRLCWRAVAICIEAVGSSYFGQPAGSSVTTSSTSATTTAVNQEPSQDISSILPCLVLLGRLFLMLAQKLSAPQDAAGIASGQEASDAAAVALLGVQMCDDWLSLPSFQQQMAAAGYQSEELLQDLQQLGAARDQFEAAAAGEEVLAQSLMALQEPLTAVGQRLCTVATPAFCNNPNCSNLAGPTELSLVARPASTCGGCLVARYCSTACQHVHWKGGHKPVCKALAAAAAAAAEGAAEGAAGSFQPAV